MTTDPLTHAHTCLADVRARVRALLAEGREAEIREDVPWLARVALNWAREIDRLERQNGKAAPHP